jgi:hypothetical protein
MNLLPARRCFTEDPSHSSGLSFWLIGVARIADQQKYIMLSRIICGLMLSLSAHNTAFDSCKIEPAYFFERRVVGSASLYEGGVLLQATDARTERWPLPCSESAKVILGSPRAPERLGVVYRTSMAL